MKGFVEDPEGVDEFDEVFEEAQAEESEADWAPEEESGLTEDITGIYLRQMGETPLLTRPEEISIAKRIELTRRKVRKTLLGTDYVIAAMVELLQRVMNGSLGLDRGLEVSITDHQEKACVRKKLPPNLRTLEALCQANRQDFRMAISKSRTLKEKRQAWSRMCLRRRKMVRLIEETPIRNHRILPYLAHLQEISRKMDEFKRRTCHSPRWRRG